jgi:hypothetical protein
MDLLRVIICHAQWSLASLELKYGNKFVTGGEDMWGRLFDFFTGEELGKLLRFHRFLNIIELITTVALSEFFFFQCCHRICTVLDVS